MFDEFDFEEGVDVFGGCFQGKVLDASEGSGLQGLDVGCYFLAWSESWDEGVVYKGSDLRIEDDQA